MWEQQTGRLLQERNHFSVLTFIPLLFCTTCHMWASTRLWGAGGCWGWSDGLRGATAKAPSVFRLWSGAHTQFMITWGGGRRMFITRVQFSYHGSNLSRITSVCSLVAQTSGSRRR